MHEPIIPRPGEGAVWLETGEERGDEGIHRDFESTAAKTRRLGANVTVVIRVMRRSDSDDRPQRSQ